MGRAEKEYGHVGQGQLPINREAGLIYEAGGTPRIVSKGSKWVLKAIPFCIIRDSNLVRVAYR